MDVGITGDLDDITQLRAPCDSSFAVDLAASGDGALTAAEARRRRCANEAVERAPGEPAGSMVRRTGRSAASWR